MGTTRTARVFEQKLKRLIHDIVDRQRFGRTIGYICVIEFQKRGLPHVHLLLILAPEFKPKTADQFDKLTCAELPPKDNVQLRQKVCAFLSLYLNLNLHF